MPKLSHSVLIERLRKRIADLENGEAFEARDINALLTDTQQQALKAAWAEQQALRKVHRQPATDEKKREIGWKTIREVRLDIYRQALNEAQGSSLAALREEQRKKEVRKAKVFMDAFSDALANGKGGDAAQIAGHIAVTRAGFGRNHVTNKRDNEFWEIDELSRQEVAGNTDENED